LSLFIKFSIHIFKFEIVNVNLLLFYYV